MAGKIFISYRRDDTRADARSVDQRLRNAFGGDRIFFDVDTIQKGKDFRKVLAQALDTSNVLLAIIGPTWLSGKDATGRRRIDDPNDFVRLEIGSALKRDIAVIPVLVGGAKMPLEQDLPADLKGLVYRQVAIITHDNFPRDVDGIERDIAALIGGGKRRAGGAGKRLGMAATLVALLITGAVAASWLGVPMPWTAPSVDAASDPVRLAVDKAKAEVEVKRLADAEERLKAEAKRKADEVAAQQAALEAKRQAEAADVRRRIEDAENARVEAGRQQQAVLQADENRKKFETQSAENKRKAEETEAQLKAQEVKLMAEAAEAKRQAEQEEAARLAAQTKVLADTAEQRKRAAEALAERKAIEEEAKRTADEARRNRPREMRFLTWAYFNEQCRSTGLPQLEIAKSPKFGTSKSEMKML